MGLALAARRRQAESISPYQLGGVGNGIADDSYALLAAINARRENGGGIVDLSGGVWLVDSADINLPQGVALIGPNVGFGRSGLNTNWANIPGSIILNPAHTLKVTGRGAQVSGTVIIRKGLAAPSSIRQAYDAIAAFAGTAITLGSLATAGDANDAHISDCFIIGFAQAMESPWNSRSRIENVRGDCTSGIRLANSYDMQHLAGCHFYPFLTQHMAPYSCSVVGAADSGAGLVRLEVSSNTNLSTGDVVNINGVGGTTEANGRQTITVVDDAHIDLQGVAFVHAYTSGGSVMMNPYRRNGRAYWFDGAAGPVDWGQIRDSFCYGYDVGFLIESSDYTTLVNCGADNYGPAGDIIPVGFDIAGTCKSASLSSCKAAAQGKNYRVRTSAATEDNVVFTGCRSWSARSRLYSLEDGYVALMGCTGRTGGSIFISKDCAGLDVIGGDYTGVQFDRAAGAPAPRCLNARGILGA